MNDEEFFKEYERVVRMGLWSGALNAPPRTHPSDAPFIDEAHMRKFIHGCHRGYEKAQNRTLELIQIIKSEGSLTPEERGRRELLLRKIVDGIAVLLFQAKSHVLRRFILHKQPQNLSLPVVATALASANALNVESRWTFALVADLTTFIHVCDIVRVDFRNDRRSVSLIELKSGRVNEILIAQLDKYAPTEKSVGKIATDPVIDPKHRAQAQRIMRQRIRLAQINEVIKTDKGTDIVTKHPIRLSKDEVKGAVYDKFLSDLLERARKEGVASGVVNHCIHIGVGYDANRDVASQNAERAVKSAIKIHLAKPPKGFPEVFSEARALVPDYELFKTSELLNANLAAMNVRPFTIWGLPLETIVEIARAKFVILSAFDVASFMWLARQCGLAMRFSTPTEATQQAQRFGSAQHLPTWGGRALVHQSGEAQSFIASGSISRFINDLTNPLPFLIHDAREAGVFRDPQL